MVVWFHARVMRTDHALLLLLSLTLPCHSIDNNMSDGLALTSTCDRQPLGENQLLQQDLTPQKSKGPEVPQSCDDNNDDLKKLLSKGPDYQQVLLAYSIGGWGNHMWIYASLYGLAIRTHRTPIFCGKQDLRNLFSNLSVAVFSELECGTQEIGNRMRYGVYAKQANYALYHDVDIVKQLKEAGTQLGLLGGYLQNLKYFDDVVDDLRAQFAIRESYRVLAQDHLRQLVGGSTGRVFIAVHVRRKDAVYSTHMTVPPRAYFNRAMDVYRTKYPTSAFVVITDDVHWSKDNIKGADVFFAVDVTPAIRMKQEDFSLGVACNHTVLSVGTFGWWVGLLTGGDVIYYRDFAKGLHKQWLVKEEYFPANWTAIG